MSSAKSSKILEGVVVRGDGRGRVLGFPTANLVLTAGVLPATGIWAGYVFLPGEKKYAGAFHIGPLPTFNVLTPRLEVHLLDYAGPDFYGQTVKMKLIEKIRDVIKFSSTEALQAAIGADCDRVRALLNKI